MTKFAGKVGFAPEEYEERPGVWKKKPNVYRYRGEILKNTRSLNDGTKVNDDITVGVSISIVADAYAREHFHDLLFVEWQGVKWKVSSVEPLHPRLVLRLGGRYHGPNQEA